MKLVSCLLGLTVLCGYGRTAGAQTCTEPTMQERQAVSAYVVAKYHLGDPSSLTLLKSEKANDGCFWTFQYETAQKKQLSFYLSPDRRFLTTELLDLRIDPQKEERQKAESIMTSLLAGDPPALGPKNAPVTIVEFSDFECPFCQRLKAMLEQEVLPKEPGKVRVVFRNFPLPMHPWAKPAALLAACAGLQDDASFWKVHDFLFDNQRTLTPDNITPKVTEFVSTSTKLDPSQFKKCVDRDLTLGMITKDMALGQQNGVRATPTAFINGVRYEGVQSAAQMIAIIEDISGKSSTSLKLPLTNPSAAPPVQCAKPSASASR